MKLNGFNIQDLNVDFKDTTKYIKEDISMQQTQPTKKKKIKFNFDNLFPAPKNNKSMGLDDFGNQSKAFEGVI